MIAPGLLYFRRCCALRLEGKSQKGFFLSVSLLKGVQCFVVTSLHDSLHLIVPAGMHPVCSSAFLFACVGIHKGYAGYCLLEGRGGKLG